MPITISHYRFGTNTGTETTHGWHANEDTNPTPGTIALDTTALLRFCTQADGSAYANADWQFEYRKNGGTWTSISTSSTNVRAVTPSCWANADTTTQRLSGTGTFEDANAGCTVDGTSGGTAYDLAANENCETELAFQLRSADLVGGDYVEFRITSIDGYSLTYSYTPRLDIPHLPAPGTGTITLTGIAPTAVMPIQCSPATGSVGLVGVAAALVLTVATSLGSVTVAGIAPTLASSLAPPSGAITLTEIAPTVASALVPATGDITLAGVAPTVGTGSPSWTTVKQFNFRQTSDYVTDGANATYVLGDTYDVTRSIGGQNVTFGWATSGATLNTRNRSLTVDVRLAGINFLDADGERYFRVDLPAAGTYGVRLALGDTDYGHNISVIIKDGVGGSTLTTIQSSVASGSFLDANGDAWSAANWPGSNTQAQLEFTGTVCCIYLYRDGTYDSCIAHLELEQLPEGATTPATGVVAFVGIAPAVLDSREVPTGAVSLAGVAPTLADTLPVPVGAIDLIGIAPTASTGGQTVPVPTGAVTLTGSYIEYWWPGPDTGSVTFEGSAPTVWQTRAIPVPAGAISTTGLSPALAFSIVPATGALALTGIAPTALTEGTVAPGVGAVTLTGTSPTLVVAVAPATGAISLVGIAPTLPQGGITVSVPTGAVSLTGGEVRWGAPGPATGALTLTGIAPTVLLAQGPSPSTGAIDLTGIAPTLISVVAPATGSLALTGVAPVALTTGAVAPDTGAVLLAGVAPTLHFCVVPNTGAVVLSGVAPVALTAGTVAPDRGVVTLTGVTPTLGWTGSLTIGVPTGETTFTGTTPSLRVVLGVPVGATTLAGQAPTLTSTVSPATGALTTTGAAPAVASGLPVPAGSVTATGNLPTLHLWVAVPQGSLSLTGLSPVVLTGGMVAPDAGATTLTGQFPTLAFQVVVPTGALTLVGLEPFVSQGTEGTRFPATGTILFSGADVTIQDIVCPDTGLIRFTPGTVSIQAPFEGHVLGLSGPSRSFTVGMTGLRTITGPGPYEVE